MIKCIIIDDEVLARRLLKDYIGKIPELELVAQFENPLQAKTVIAEQKIDLMFLDIQMPEITGIEFLKSLKEKPLTILTTAYSEYALQSYELDVIDYLLKPFPFKRFYSAVNKVLDYLQFKSAAVNAAASHDVAIESYEEGYFFVKADYKITRINFREILFIEGLKEYIRIHTENKKLVTYFSMQKMEELLPRRYFFRVHKSYIANLQKIDSIKGNVLFISGNEVLLSKSRRNEFFTKINKQLLN